jgi:hypothetical protein
MTNQVQCTHLVSGRRTGKTTALAERAIDQAALGGNVLVVASNWSMLNVTRERVLDILGHLQLSFKNHAHDVVKVMNYLSYTPKGHPGYQAGGISFVTSRDLDGIRGLDVSDIMFDNAEYISTDTKTAEEVILETLRSAPRVKRAFITAERPLSLSSVIYV